jgi:PAS domain S-box-containing protein
MYSVLFVDDEPDLLEVAKEFLESSTEFSVDTKRSARESLDSLMNHRYDAVVSDFQMPGMNGIAFLKEVRSFSQDIPFILFTGRGREEVVIEALNNGADFYLQKGGDPETAYAELMHMIRRAIRMRQAQVTLAEQEQRYHDLQNASDMIQSVAPNGHFLFVNKKWQDTLDYSEEELPCLTLFDIIHEESLEHFKSLFTRIIAGENVGIIDVVFRTRDGRKVYAEGLATCKLVDGQPQYTRGIFKDVTDRRQAEAALRESEEKFRTLVDYTMDGILILDPKGTVLFANQAAGKIIEKEDYQEAIGVSNVLDFIAPESKADVLRDFGQVAQGTDGYIARYKVRTARQQERWVESIGKSITFGGNPAILISLRDITDRQRAETVLQESENRFRSIFESNPYPVAINSIPDMKFLAVNRAFLDVSGFKEADTLGKSPVELGLISLTEAAKLVSRAALTGKIENVPLALTVTAGKRVHVLFSTVPVTINNQPACLTMTVETTKLKRVEEELIQKNEDLNAAYEELTSTEEELRANYDALIRQEQALRESEEKYRLLTEMTNDIIYLIDRQGSVTYIGPQVSRYGFSPGDIISHKFIGFVAEESRPTAAADLEKALSTRTPIMSLMKVHDRDGKCFWMESNGAPVIDDTGTVTAISGILRDVTERKAAEDALRESEEKFRALVEYSLDGIFIIEFSGLLLFANQAACRIVQEEDCQSIIGGKNVMEFIAPESRSAALHDIDQVAQGIDAYLVNYKLITMKKKECWVECIGKKIPYGSSHAMLVFMRDITSRKQMEEAILRTNKQLSLLSSITRHDVLNKIAVIQGYLALAEKRGDKQDYPALIEKIAPIIAVIGQQIEFTRVYQNLGTKKPEWQKPKKFLSSALVPGSVRISNGLGDLEIFADLMLEKVFQNLVDNSIRHGGGVTEIRLDSHPDPDGITIVCEDNGAGIPADEKEKIFRRGYGKNTGLGLFLAREILGITGITIRETGEAGKGARFEIHVPAGGYRSVVV